MFAAVLACPKIPLALSPRDEAAVLAVVVAAAVAVLGVKPKGRKACGVVAAGEEGWKRLAVADAAGNPPGRDGF